MIEWIETIVEGALFGVLVYAVSGMLFFAFEQKWPVLRGQTEEEKAKSGAIFTRMTLCVWIAGALAYILLRHPN